METLKKIKINIGAGNNHLKTFINIDINPDKKPDIVADCRDLPFKDNSVDEIYCGHLLEHLTIENFNNTIKEMHRVLKAGGKITITIPDLVRAIDGYKKHKIEWALIQLICFGDEPKPEFGHKIVLNDKVLMNSLKPYFKDLKLVFCSNLASNIAFWQSIIEGYK